MRTRLKPIIQHPHDLMLVVTEHDNLPATQTLCEHLWQAGDWAVRFIIIGESHRVDISYKGHCQLQEMLACVQLPVGTYAHHHPFKDVNIHRHQQGAYQVRVTMHDDLSVWQAQDDELVYYFPPIDGFVPVTRIQWQIIQGGIAWRTLHTYYNDKRITCVYSDSRYTFAQD
ncbi:MAG: DUF2617 family protein [Anaerolineae bacterium]